MEDLFFGIGMQGLLHFEVHFEHPAFDWLLHFDRLQELIGLSFVGQHTTHVLSSLDQGFSTVIEQFQHMGLDRVDF